MKRIVAYIVIILCLAGCGKQWDKRLTLWRNDKIAYGTYYAYKNLPFIFTESEIEKNTKSPLTFYSSGDSSSAYIFIGESLRPDENELKALLNYAYSGNHVFISAMNIGDNVLDSFRVSIKYGDYINFLDSLTTSVLHPVNNHSLSFSYPGLNLAGYFDKIDSSITYILGKDEKGRPNFIKFNYDSGGSVFLHLAPTAFSNFSCCTNKINSIMILPYRIYLIRLIK